MCRFKLGTLFWLLVWNTPLKYIKWFRHRSTEAWGKEQWKEASDEH